MTTDAVWELRQWPDCGSDGASGTLSAGVRNPAEPWLVDLDLGTVWRYRELLLVLIMRDIQVLYRQAALGSA